MGNSETTKRKTTTKPKRNSKAGRADYAETRRKATTKLKRRWNRYGNEIDTATRLKRDRIETAKRKWKPKLPKKSKQQENKDGDKPRRQRFRVGDETSNELDWKKIENKQVETVAKPTRKPKQQQWPKS